MGLCRQPSPVDGLGVFCGERLDMGIDPAIDETCTCTECGRAYDRLADQRRTQTVDSHKNKVDRETFAMLSKLVAQHRQSL